MTYPGGKNGAGVAQLLVNLMPPHHTYIEPFLGSGAVMRLKRPAQRNFGVDLNPEPVKLLASLLSAKVATGDPGAIAAAADCGSAFPRPGGPTDFGDSAGNLAISGERRRDPLPEVWGWPVPGGSDVKRSPIAESAFLFRQGDGIEFLAGFPFSGDGRELVYCDPPYMMCSERSGKAIYRHEMSEEEHVRLLRLIRRLPCLVLISGYWSALYAHELRAWNRVTFEGHTRKGPKTEWVWFNFPKPLELHDYRYLGRGFRERERIKRKVARWTARLAAMPILERQALLSAIARTAGNLR